MSVEENVVIRFVPGEMHAFVMSVDGFLAEMEADRAHSLAADNGLDRLAAMSRHIAARVLGENGKSMAAIERYRESAQLYAIDK